MGVNAYNWVPLYLIAHIHKPMGHYFNTGYIMIPRRRHSGLNDCIVDIGYLNGKSWLTDKVYNLHHDKRVKL